MGEHIYDCYQVALQLLLSSLVLFTAMSTERIKMFPQTQSIVIGRIRNVEDRLSANTAGLSEMGDDGDSMDDPYMWKLHAEREELQQQLRDLNRLLGPQVDIINSEFLETESVITVGTEVDLLVKYFEGDKEKLRVTIGSSVDKIYLGQDRTLFVGDNILISEESSLAQALLGKGMGDSVSFETPSGESSAKVLNIQPSVLLNSKP